MKNGKSTYAERIRQKLRKDNIEIDPLLDATIEELERLGMIRDDLYRSYLTKDELFKEYTNKGGATNTIIAQEVTEYKNYSDKFNKTVAAIEKMLSTRIPDKPVEVPQLDPFQQILMRTKSS